MNIILRNDKPGRRNSFIRSLAFAILLGSLVGCATVTPPPEIDMDTSASSMTLTTQKAKNSWARVLATHVNEKGQIDFKAIADDPHDLNRFVRYIALVSPETHPGLFPGKNHRLAYYINAYNALAMYGVIRKGIPESFQKFSARAQFFKFTKFTIGETNISLYNFENDVIRQMGEPRIHFALNCMVRGCPRLPQVPFEAQKLDAQLNAVAIEFFADPKNIQVDKQNSRVVLSEILKFYTEDFTNQEDTKTLVQYVNKYRNRRIPESFRVGFIPYDWRLNSQ